MPRFWKLFAVAALAASGGCATFTEDSTEQLLEIHAVQDNRELAGVGCVLSNRLGRWFVVAPGRVKVARNPQPLTIDCGRDGIGRAVELVASRFDTHKLIGNVVTTAGLGYMVDRHSGAGFGYPATLTVLIPKAPPREAEWGAPDNRVF
jgi:hypothetical protein